MSIFILRWDLYVDLAGLELLGSPYPPASASRVFETLDRHASSSSSSCLDNMIYFKKNILFLNKENCIIYCVYMMFRSIHTHTNRLAILCCNNSVCNNQVTKIRGHRLQQIICVILKPSRISLSGEQYGSSQKTSLTMKFLGFELCCLINIHSIKYSLSYASQFIHLFLLCYAHSHSWEFSPSI